MPCLVPPLGQPISRRQSLIGHGTVFQRLAESCRYTEIALGRDDARQALI